MEKQKNTYRFLITVGFQNKYPSIRSMLCWYQQSSVGTTLVLHPIHWSVCVSDREIQCEGSRCPTRSQNPELTQLNSELWYIIMHGSTRWLMDSIGHPSEIISDSIHFIPACRSIYQMRTSDEKSKHSRNDTGDLLNNGVKQQIIRGGREGGRMGRLNEFWLW